MNHHSFARVRIDNFVEKNDIFFVNEFMCVLGINK